MLGLQSAREARAVDLLNAHAPSKILTTLVSTFTSVYCRQWTRFFPDDPLDPDDEGPSFDGRIVQYATDLEIIDYLKWRQGASISQPCSRSQSIVRLQSDLADAAAHINNLYNTTFWALVQQGGLSTTAAHAELSVCRRNRLPDLQGTVSSQKHEILFKRFGINYNSCDEMFKRGSLLLRRPVDDQASIFFAPS